MLKKIHSLLNFFIVDKVISILIPTYNYNVYPLVKQLHQEAIGLGIKFEIKVYDDHSPNPYPENEKINFLPNSKYIYLEKNLGRSAIRNTLATEAIYPTLLFLDADVMPANTSFLKQFIASITPETDLVFGGILYQINPPEASKILRWKYGKAREARTLHQRKENPYLSIISACFLIKKSIFLKTNTFLENSYGIDILFSQNLQQEKARIAHINNPVIHFGLETNTVFIEKTKLGLETLASFTKQKKIPSDCRPLQQKYIQLKRNGFLPFFQSFIQLSEKLILKNLVSPQPSLFLFDIYRLYYYSKIIKDA